MQLFENNKNVLVPIQRDSFNLWQEIPTRIKQKLDSVFGLLVTSEFTVGQFRLDTLAFSREANAFVEPDREMRVDFTDSDFIRFSIRSHMGTSGGRAATVSEFLLPPLLIGFLLASFQLPADSRRNYVLATRRSVSGC